MKWDNNLFIIFVLLLFFCSLFCFVKTLLALNAISIFSQSEFAQLQISASNHKHWKWKCTTDAIKMANKSANDVLRCSKFFFRVLFIQRSFPSVRHKRPTVPMIIINKIIHSDVCSMLIAEQSLKSLIRASWNERPFRWVNYCYLTVSCWVCLCVFFLFCVFWPNS